MDYGECLRPIVVLNARDLAVGIEAAWALASYGWGIVAGLLTGWLGVTVIAWRRT